MSRLIDADKLIEALKGKEVMWYPDVSGNTYDGATYDCTTILDIIEEQPTAFDVEKVVDSLEQRADKCFSYTLIHQRKNEKERCIALGIAYNTAANIVRQGVVDA